MIVMVRFSPKHYFDGSTKFWERATAGDRGPESVERCEERKPGDDDDGQHNLLVLAHQQCDWIYTLQRWNEADARERAA